MARDSDKFNKLYPGRDKTGYPESPVEPEFWAAGRFILQMKIGCLKYAKGQRQHFLRLDVKVSNRPDPDLTVSFLRHGTLAVATIATQRDQPAQEKTTGKTEKCCTAHGEIIFGEAGMEVRHFVARQYVAFSKRFCFITIRALDYYNNNENVFAGLTTKRVVQIVVASILF